MAYARVTALGTTPIVYSGMCKLNRVVINTKGASSNLLTLRDGGADGKIVAIIDTTGSSSSLNYGGQLLSNGLTAVSATGSAGDITIFYE
jgi:hypothetical protein